jgi:integrase
VGIEAKSVKNRVASVGKLCDSIGVAKMECPSCRALEIMRIAVIRKVGAFATTLTITACPKAKNSCGSIRRNFFSDIRSARQLPNGQSVSTDEHDATVDALITRYKLDVIPKKAAATRRGDMQALINLRKVFGAMRPGDVLPRHIYKYVDTRVSKNSESSRATGLYEIRVFRHIFTKAVEWGILDRHPFKGEVHLRGLQARDRYAEDWEIAQALALKPKRNSGSVLMIQAYIQLKLLIGIRRGDMLRLRMSDLTDAGIMVRPHKTRNSKRTARIFEWTPALKLAVEQAKAARPIDFSPWLFCTSKGEGTFAAKSAATKPALRGPATCSGTQAERLRSGTIDANQK